MSHSRWNGRKETNRPEPVRGSRPALLLLAAAVVATLQATPLLAQPEKGGKAPLFELQSLGGDQVSLADFRGRLVVLHFGTGW